MNKLRAFIRLDLITVKPYFTLKTLALFGGIVLFITLSSGEITSGTGAGMMSGMLFLSYPFALSEKNNLDTLYTILSVDRKTVVLGRYIFTLLLSASAILLFLIIGIAGHYFTGILDGSASGAANEVRELLWVMPVLCAFFLIIQSLQFPVYFKYPYSKARFLSLVPFFAIMAGYLTIGKLFSEFPTNLTSNNMTIPLFLAVSLIILFLSYLLSVWFYKRREF